MLLYKYRALSNPESALDILLNQRLYCSYYSELNDPFEGLFIETIPFPLERILPLSFLGFTPPDKLNLTKSVDDLPWDSKDQIRICSLSASSSNILLWSHYAEGHKGIAIELDVSGLEEMIHKVRYTDELANYSSELIPFPSTKELFTSKTKHWKYESEYRVLYEGNYFNISGRITRILMGSRITPMHIKLLEKICQPEVPLVHTEIDTELLTVKERKG